jgi:hypothetical protein
MSLIDKQTKKQIMENVLETVEFTKLSLNYKEFDALYMSILTRIERIENLIKNWQEFPSNDSELFIIKYSEEKQMLENLGKKLLNFNN